MPLLPRPAWLVTQYFEISIKLAAKFNPTPAHPHATMVSRPGPDHCHAIARQQFRPLADDRFTGVLTLALIPVHGVAQLGSNTGRAWMTRRHASPRLIGFFALGSLLAALLALLAGFVLGRIEPTLIPLLVGLFILALTGCRSRSSITAHIRSVY
jgi:hypothetical protein